MTGRYQPNGMRTPAIEPLEARILLSGFTAYNDTVAGPLTHANTTLYADNGGTSSGQLKDIVTGAYTPVNLTTRAVSVFFGGTGVNPAAGTPAANIFGGYVDFSSGYGSNSIEISGASSYTYDFTNLDPGNTYDFVGTHVRGSSSYTDRWTLVTLVGADSFTPAHSTGVGIVTAGLQPNQVAIWTGANQLSTQGFVVQWTNINPGADGEFEVLSQQYTGAIPTSVDPAGVADGPKGYGLSGIRLVEHAPTAPPTVVTTAATNIAAFSAEIGGRVVSTGGQAPNVTLYYGDNDGGTTPGAWDNWVDLGPQTGTFSQAIGGLSQATSYYFRAYAVNSVGAAWAPTTESFITLTATAPAVVNLSAANVGAFSAVLSGRVTATGNDPPLVTIYYGKSDGGADAGAWSHSVEVGVQAGVFAATVTGLEPQSTYYFTARARNAVGGAWATPSLVFATGSPPPLEITEFMADNSTTLTTRTRASATVPFAGDYISPDWLEIHNPTDAVAILDGFYLTDDLDVPRAWEFPAGTSIAPGGYLVVFASGLDITDPALDEHGYLHTNFKFKTIDEDVALVDHDGVVVSAYEDFPQQTRGTSYGLGADGHERYFAVPTPGWDNANDVPQAPRFSVSGRTFSGSVQVNLTASYPTDVIRYTLDETAPTASSPVWTGPRTLTNTTMIRALSISSSGKSSQPVGETYVALGADVLSASSNLPVVVVETFGDAVPWPGGGFGDAYIALFEPGSDGRTRLTSLPTLGTRAGIHIRGSSSAGFPKQQYRVEFRDETDVDRQVDVLGMPVEADWILYAPGTYDRALITNPLMYDLSNQVGRYAVRTRWVEMYLNVNGGQVTASDYVGVYAIMEVIERGDDRVDIGPLSTGAGGVPVSGGFIWKNDRGSPYVEPEVPTVAQQTYINSWINGLEAASTGPNFKSPTLGYAAWADVGSFVDHNLLNLLAMNVDAMRLSGFYYKTADGLIEAGPIWDFDRSLESTDSRDDNPLWWNGTGDSTLFFNDNSRVRMWWPQMFQDPDFVQRYIDRWFELRRGSFSLANINATIDAHAAQIQESAARDYTRWAASRYGNFAGEIQHMKTWLTSRINWIDSQWVARPTVNVAGPVVAPGTRVTLSAPAGSIYYTLDGTDPRAAGGGISSHAILASGSIPINLHTHLTARVYRPNYVPSGGAPGYIPAGDDWSAPLAAEYFVNPLAAPGDVVISEINYHPYDPTPAELAAQPPAAPDFQGSDFEFIEFMNVGGHTADVGGVSLGGGVEFTFDSLVLTPGQRVVLVGNLAGFTARYGINGSLAGTGITVAGQWAGDLNNDGELLTVAARDGAAIQNFAYSDTGNWPDRADGKGAALELANPWGVPTTEPARQDYLQDGNNWRSSTRFGGSPGAADHTAPSVVINEVLTHTDDPLTDAIELHNTSATVSVNISGWYLSDSWGWDWNPLIGDYKKFRIPAGTVLAPGEYKVFDQGHFAGGVMYFDADEFGGGAKGFGLDAAHGDDVWLMKADAQGNLTDFVDHVSFYAAANGESLGRWPDASGDLFPMITRTLGAVNSGPLFGPVVISEVQYNPGASQDLEFIEVCNPTLAPVNLWEHYYAGGQWRDYPWKVEGFVFPAGTTLAPGEALVVVPFDPSDAALLDAFKSQYGLSGSGVRIFGGYGAHLDNGSEAVRLWLPDGPPLEEPSFTPYLLVDEVRYDDAAPWPVSADGGGMSLHRVSDGEWGDAAANWRAAAPTPGAAALGAPPRVTAVLINPDQAGPVRTVGEVDPSAGGVRTVVVKFNEIVTFSPSDVLAQKVALDSSGHETIAGALVLESATGSGTREMRITFADPSHDTVDTWVKVTLTGSGTVVDTSGRRLDGEPANYASGATYIRSAAEGLPTGNGAAGGSAVFYVGNLRGDYTGDRSVTQADLSGFSQCFMAGNLLADFRGVGFGATAPDGRLTVEDIDGFAAVYQKAVATPGWGLGPLPPPGGPLAGEVIEVPVAPTPAEIRLRAAPVSASTPATAGMDILADAAGWVPAAAAPGPSPLTVSSGGQGLAASGTLSAPADGEEDGLLGKIGSQMRQRHNVTRLFGIRWGLK